MPTQKKNKSDGVADDPKSPPTGQQRRYIKALRKITKVLDNLEKDKECEKSWKMHTRLIRNAMEESVSRAICFQDGVSYDADKNVWAFTGKWKFLKL